MMLTCRRMVVLFAMIAKPIPISRSCASVTFLHLVSKAAHTKLLHQAMICDEKDTECFLTSTLLHNERLMLNESTSVLHCTLSSGGQ